MPWCDTYAMTQHLAEISRHVADDAMPILIIDQRAGTCPIISSSQQQLDPATAAEGPELNPVENLWHFMRERLAVEPRLQVL